MYARHTPLGQSVQEPNFVMQVSDDEYTDDEHTDDEHTDDEDDEDEDDTVDRFNGRYSSYIDDVIASMSFPKTSHRFDDVPAFIVYQFR